MRRSSVDLCQLKHTDLVFPGDAPKAISLLHRVGQIFALRGKCGGHIQRSLNRYNEETTGKNENAVRSFVLSDLAYNVLQAQRAFSGTSEFIFSIGTQSGYLKRWNRYCEVNGLTITTPYEMRHTFVSIAKGLPEGQVKSIVGHSANMDTFGIYGHSIEGEQEQAAHDLNTIFANVLTPKENNKG